MKKAISEIGKQGVQIVYSDDYLDVNNYILDSSSKDIQLIELKDYLQSIGYQLNRVKPKLYFIKPIQLTTINNPIGIVVVTVLDSETKQMIQNAKISIENRNDIKYQYSNGNYTFIGLKSAHYKFNISEDDYESFEWEFKLSEDEIVTKELYLKAKPVALNNLLVTTSHYDFDIEDNSQQIVVFAEELKSTPHIGNDPARAVAKLPGLTSNGITARQYVRGGKADESGIRLNGLELKDPYHFKDFFGIFSILDLSYTEDVSLYAGVFPSKFGNHISSVMSVNSLTPDRPFFIDASIGLFNSHFTTGGELQNGSKYIASLRSGGDFFHTGAFDIDVGEPRYDDSFLSYTHDLNSGIEVQANVLISRDRIAIDIVNEDEFADAHYQDQNYWVSVNNSNFNNFENDSLFFYQKNQSDRNGFLTDEEISGNLFESQNLMSFGASTEFDFSINEGMSFNLGGSWSYSKTQNIFNMSLNSEHFITELLGQDSEIIRNHDFNNSGSKSSIHANLRYQFNQRFIADFGLRVDQQSWIDERQVSPRMNLSYFYDQQTTYRLGLGRHQQVQEIDELLFEESQLQYYKPEIADVIVVEMLKQLDNDLSLRLEAYYKDYKQVQPYYENLFIGLHLHPELFSDRIRVAPESSQAKGIDLTLTKKYDSFKWSLGYSFASIIDVVDNETQHRSWDQKNGLKLSADWSHKNWDISALMMAHSGWPRTFITENDGELIVAERNKNRNKDFINLDLRAAYHFKMKQTDSTFWFQVSNALNRMNQCCSEYSYEENQQGVFELIDEPKKWLPLIPSLGLNIYFD